MKFYTCIDKDMPPASKHGVMTLFCDEKRGIQCKRKDIENKGDGNRKKVEEGVGNKNSRKRREL